MSTYQLPLRLKRLRQTTAVRSMLQETRLDIAHFIAPLFVSATLEQPCEISSMPGQFQLPLSSLIEHVTTLANLGIQAVLLFGLPASKDAIGSASLDDEHGVIQQAIRIIRQSHPEMLIIADVCFCEYTDHGHCGALSDGRIDNDETLVLLTAQAISYAKAGAHWVAPSSNTDGMVGAIRQGLDQAGFINTAILSYAVKYCSSFYAPFREAGQGAPQFGDRKHYQMDIANSREALREAALDVAEGADSIMVKPAMNYLDIIVKIKQQYPEVPLCAYQVSGEYAMLKKAAACGIIDEQHAIMESLIAIKRAGADLIISYFAKDIAQILSSR
jgi:porphobilinogen synthase